MEKQSLQNAVTAIVAAQLNRSVETCAPDAELVEHLGADPLDLLEITMDVEDRFAVELRDEDVASFKTIDDIVSALRRLAESKAA